MANIIKLDTIDSTSAWARKHLADFEDFTVISADNQTKGYGQFERTWLSSSEHGGNCYISLVLKPQNSEHLNDLTQYTSKHVKKTLEGYGLEPVMKYPNDVLIYDKYDEGVGKKIAGILAESVFIGNLFKGVVVGVGVNLNLGEDEIKTIDIPATSVFLETAKNVDKWEFIDNFLKSFKSGWEEFLLYGNKGEILCQM